MWGSRNGTRGAIALVLLALLLGASAVRGAEGTSGWVPVPVLPPASDRVAGQGCVEPTEIIRREHMHFLMHQRDRTVYQGARAQKHSLKGCVACHVSRDDEGRTIPVNAAGQFCAECHAYAAVKMDCFECHATRPDSGRRRAAGTSR